MTREEMIEGVGHALSGEMPDIKDKCFAAIDELRKTCATCRHYKPIMLPGMKPDAGCLAWTLVVRVPADGSGFCHRWEQVQP